MEITLQNRIRVLRAEEKISQETLAEKIGVSRQTINSIENNVYVPSALLALTIAKYFNKNFEEVFTLKISD